MSCSLCPRMCAVDRTHTTGFCGVGQVSHIARVALHQWEEPFLSGKNGSGTIFFCGCNLRCIFCQNYEISCFTLHGDAIPITPKSLAESMLTLQRAKAHNINLVTPTPHINTIVAAIPIARDMGLSIPIAYNTNSYMSLSALKALDGLIDIYIPDLKYVTPQLSAMLSGAADYPQNAIAAIEEMYRQCGQLLTDDEGIAQRGVAIRHLVLPGNIAESRKVLDIIAEKFPSNIYISLMAQYFPAHKAISMPPFDRKLLPREYKRVVDYADALGFTNIFTQEITAATEEYVPAWFYFEK